MSRSVDELLSDALNAIARARVAEKRLRLANSLADDVGVQIADQAFLHNLVILREAVTEIPEEFLDQAPEISWADIVVLGDVSRHQYQPVVPADSRNTVESVLEPLELAIRRIRAARKGSH